MVRGNMYRYLKYLSKICISRLYLYLELLQVCFACVSVHFIVQDTYNVYSIIFEKHAQS